MCAYSLKNLEVNEKQAENLILKKGVLAMSASNILTLATLAVSYVFYSRLMTPGEFAIYASALAIAKFGTMILDGGLKLAIVKNQTEVSPEVLRAIFLGSLCACLFVGSLFTALLYITVIFKLIDPDNAIFLVFYGLAYFISYPFLFIPLAQLERRQEFVHISKIESLSVITEYTLPAIMWYLVSPGFWSFALAAFIARFSRSILVVNLSNNFNWLFCDSRPDWVNAKKLLLEGFSLQLAVLLSMLRDNIHLIVIGPLFGKEWAGFYAWSLQMCSVASQVFVQTATRVVLPALRINKSKGSRWKSTLEQIAWLTIFTGPLLVFLTNIADITNKELFHSKWTPALYLIPFLSARMLSGLAVTPLGPLILIELNARKYATVNALWTIGEFLVAILFVNYYGPYGLVWSYCFMGWFGVALFANELPLPTRFLSLLPPIFFRPSLWIAFLSMILYRVALTKEIISSDPFLNSGYILFAILISIFSERRLNQIIIRTLKRKILLRF